MVNKSNVAVIILNYNTPEDTVECLNSLLDMSYSTFDIFIVDNFSPNPSSFTDIENYLNKNLKKDTVGYYIKNQIKIYASRTDKNLGFAGGHNYGVRLAESKQDYQYVWLLNADIKVDKDALAHLVELGSKNESLGLIGSKIVVPDNGGEKIYIGAEYNKFTSGSKDLKLKDLVKNTNSSEIVFHKKHLSINGSALFFNLSALKNIGYLYEKYFLYFEEFDSAIRLHQKGWGVGLCLDSTVYHKQSQSIKKIPKYGIFYGVRSRLLFTFNHYKIFFFISNLYQDIKILLPVLLKLKFQVFSWIIEAHASFIKQIFTK